MRWLIVLPPMAGRGGLEQVLLTWATQRPADATLHWARPVATTTTAAAFYARLPGRQWRRRVGRVPGWDDVVALAHIIDRVRPTAVIVAVGSVAYPVLLTRLALLRTGLPLVAWWHGKPTRHMADVANALYATLPDVHWVCGEEVAADFLSVPPHASPVWLIPNPVTWPDDLRPIRPGRVPTVAYVGRWDADQKGLDYLLASYAARRRQVRLLIVGGFTTPAGPLQVRVADWLRRARQQGPVHLYDRWAADPWAVVTAVGVDYLVVPHDDEGEPLVVLEALARGLPVLARRGASQWLRRPGQNGYPFETPADLDRLLDRVATRRLPRPAITVPWDQHRPDRVWARQRASLIAWEASR